MNTKHTPGPWRALESKSSQHQVWKGDDHIASAWGTDVPGDEQLANARLIAAAPELLDALKRIVSVASVELTGRRDDVLEQARAAIAKATGTNA